ncbi:hypothetical protein D3C76_1541470 [compost metagenome]
MNVHINAPIIILIILGIKKIVRKNPLLLVFDSIITASAKAITFCNTTMTNTYLRVNNRASTKYGSSLSASIKLPKPIKL